MIEYENYGGEEKLSPSPDLASFFIGCFLGFIGGAIVFTRLGRKAAKEAIRRGAKVTREKVEEWLRKGERGEEYGSLI